MESLRSQESVAVMVVRNARARGVEVRVLLDRGRRDCWSARGPIREADQSRQVVGRCRGLSEDTARRLFGHRKTTRRGMAYWIAASRELFVRTGILFCIRQNPCVPVPAEALARLIARRSRVSMFPADFARILESEDVFCNLSALVPFTKWFEPGRGPGGTTTQAFLACVAAELPSNPDPERSELSWFRPELLLGEQRRDAMPLDFMTYASLRALADFDSVETVSREYGRSGSSR